MVRQVENGVILEVKVIPRASKSKIVGWEGKILKVKLKEVPEKGKANLALIELLAKTLKVSKSNVKIITGRTSSLKKVLLSGISVEKVVSLGV